MNASSFLAMAIACAPHIHPDTTRAIVAVESGFRPFAIGVVGGTLERQPGSRAEALATVQSLEAAGWNYSVGLAQINAVNFERLGLTAESAFDPCASLAALQEVLSECYRRALQTDGMQASVRRALSCYYSGNFTTGFRHGYLARVVKAATSPAAPAPITRSAR